MKNLVTYLILIALLISGTACTHFRQIQKSTDWKVKYDAALKYYQKKDYYRCGTLLEDIIPIIRGTEEAEYANFIQAYTYYYQKQYILSSHYFKTFTEVYGRSQYIEEAYYMYAQSLYLQSPEPTLDQKNTYEALTALQQFLNKYPYSKYAEESEAKIHELQVKLETKAYLNAKLYYKLRLYKAALVTFKNFEYDYPDSKYNEEIAFMAIETAHELAINSIYNKQEERFRNTVELYQKFVDKYENSKYQKDVERFYSDSIEHLTTFGDQNKNNN